MSKKWIRLMLCLALAVILFCTGALPAQAAGRVLVAEGTCGENVTWTLDEYGLLAISGTGAMYDYSDDSDDQRAPWLQYYFETDCAITSICVNEGITHIGNYAFEFLPEVTDVSLAESITTIGVNAFSRCTGLTSITLPSQITAVEGWTFDQCASLTSVTLPDSITYIGQHAFYMCDSLTSISLPAELVEIDSYAFAESGLTQIVIPDKVEQINQGGFFRCAALETVHIGKSLGMLTSEEAFAHCTSLTGFTVDEENGYFDTDTYGALYGDYYRTLYQFPSASPVKYYWPHPETRELSMYTFEDCTNLKGIYLPEHCARIGASAFSGCTGLKEIFLRESTDQTEMSSAWFYGCTGLEYIYLPESLTQVFPRTFDGCTNLASITVPSGVTTLGWNAFYDCQKLRSITFLGNAPTVEDSTVFEGCPSDMVIFYKEGTSGWSAQWQGFTTVAIPAEQAYAQPDATDYVNQSSRRSFKVRDFSDKNHVTQDFCVSVNGQDFYSEYKGKGDSFSCLVYTNVETIDTDVVISHEGYHTYTMPASLVANYNTITMTKDTVTDPFPQALLVDSSSRNFKTLVNVFEKTAGATEPGIDGAATPLRLYVDINWNGHGEGTVWLQQGFTTIALEDDRYNYINMGEEFAVGGSIYLCAQAADGTTIKHLTRLAVVRNSANNLPIDTGDTTDADTTQAKDNTTKLFGGTNMELNLKILEDNIPLTFISNSDGSFEVIVGIKMLKDKDERVALGTVKESIAALSKAGTAAQQQREAAKMLDKIQGFGNPHQNFGKTAVEANVQIVGYLNGRMINGERRITGGKIALMVKGEGSYTYQTYVPVVVATIPAYFKVAVEATLSTYVGLQYDDNGDFITPERLDPLDGTFQVSAAAGPGWEGYFSIGIEGAGTLGLHTTFPIKKDLTSLTVQATLKGVGTLLGQEVKFDLVEPTPEYIFWKAGDFCWEEYTCPYRLRSSLGTYSVNTARSTMVQLSATNGSIADGVSGYSIPSLTRLADGRLLAVWMADDLSRGTLDKNAAYFSVRSEDGVWSEAGKVWDDGTLDTGASLFTHAGQTWVIWSNYTQTFGETTPDYDTLAAQIDTAVARFDPETGAFTDARNLSMAGYDSLPQLLEENGNLTAVWTNGDTVYRYLYVGDWFEAGTGAPEGYLGTASILPEDYPYDWPAMACAPVVLQGNDARAVLYVAPDGSGVNNLFGIFEEAAGWGQAVQLTFLPEGQSIGGFSAELSGSRIHVLAVHRELDSESNITGACLQLLELDRTADIAIDLADYDRWTLVPGGELTIELDVTNYGSRSVSGLSLTILHSDGTSSTQQLGAELLPGESKTVFASYRLPETADPALTLQLTPMQGSDSDPSNNTAELELHLADISVDQVSADHTGEDPVVTAFLSNPGQTDLENITLVFRSNDPEGEILEEITLDSLAVGEMTTVTMGDTSALADNDLIYAQAETGLEENLMGNNTAFCMYSVPEDEDPDFVPILPGQEPEPTEPEETTEPTTEPTEPEETTQPTTAPTEPEETTQPTTAPTEPDETTQPTTAPTEPDETQPPHTHSFGQWIVVAEPTGSAEGLEQRSCLCGETDSRSIPKLSNPFTDVRKGSYYYESVLWAVYKDITTGTAKDTFTPGGECTRAQIVTFLWRAEGCPEPESTESPFTDLAKGAYYEKAVLWAVEEGITKGLTQTQFGPKSPCTRGQIVTFLHRWQGVPQASSANHSFTDISSTAFYYDAVLWALEKGITTGMTPDTFAPGSTCTRAQVVTFLHRTMKN